MPWWSPLATTKQVLVASSNTRPFRKLLNWHSFVSSPSPCCRSTLASPETKDEWMSDVWGEWRWTLRGRGGEKRREKVENGSTCFSDSIDFAIRSWDEDSCVCNCHKGWTRYVTHCRYIACCLYLAEMKKTTRSDEKKQRCDEGDE